MVAQIIVTLFSGGHVVVLILVMLLLFGGKKIPELMGGLGKGMKEFKKSMKEDEPTESKKEIKE